ncbi:MAG: DUF881 domain-containing protein [Candidatus Limnocylindria bacterium]
MTGAARRLRFRSGWALSIAAALAVVGFVAAAQWNSSAERQEFTTSAQQVLAAQVIRLEEEQRELRELIAAGEAEVQTFQEESTSSSAALAALNARLAEARLAAGLTPVRGPGAVIEIADSKRVVPPGENPASFIVLVDDLRDIVAALWASGADAIAINDERLVASSSIYSVGASVLVNTAFLSPPFRVEAIGPEGLLERFQEHPAFQGRVAQRIEFFGLEFATAAADELDLDGFVGTSRFRWAVPLEGTDG